MLQHIHTSRPVNPVCLYESSSGTTTLLCNNNKTYCKQEIIEHKYIERLKKCWQINFDKNFLISVFYKIIFTYLYFIQTHSV